MRKFEEYLMVFLTIVLVVLFVLDVFAVFHSTWFALTHIHLTRMEAMFDPGNKMGYKLLCLAGTYIDFKVLVAIAENH